MRAYTGGHITSPSLWCWQGVSLSRPPCRLPSHPQYLLLESADLLKPWTPWRLFWLPPLRIFLQRTVWWWGSGSWSSDYTATCPYSCSWRWWTVQVINVKSDSWSSRWLDTVTFQQHPTIFHRHSLPKVSIWLSKSLVLNDCLKAIERNRKHMGLEDPNLCPSTQVFTMPYSCAEWVHNTVGQANPM